MLRKAYRTVRSLFVKDRVEREMAAELSFHFEHLTEENIRRGMEPAEARSAARRMMGGVEQIKEEVREERAGHWLETTLRDIRYGFRILRRKTAQSDEIRGSQALMRQTGPELRIGPGGLRASQTIVIARETARHRAGGQAKRLAWHELETQRAVALPFGCWRSLPQ
jgi:hypothetical protein